MLEAMRNAAKTWVAKVLLMILAVSFGIFFNIGDVFRGYHRGALATAGHTEVSAEEFSRAFQNYLQQVSQQTGQGLSLEDARKLGLDRGLLNDLIRDATVEETARTMKLAVSNDLVIRDAMANPNFQGPDGKFDQQTFNRVLEQNGVTEAGYFVIERRRQLQEAVTRSASDTFSIPGTILEALYRHRTEQRDARHFVIKVAEADVVPPSDEEIKKEYEANPAAYTAPEYRSIATIAVEPGDIAASLALSEDEIKAGYEKYKADYFLAEKRTILQLTFASLDDAKKARDRISAGEDFLAVAKELGFAETDVTFADKTKAEFLDPAIADAAFSLGEGALSEPVKGGLATAILKTVKVTPEHQQTLEEVRQTLVDRLKKERAREEIQTVYDAVEDARAAETKFEDIAARAGIPFKLVGPIAASGKGKDDVAIDIGARGAEVLKASFESDVGVENDAISTDEGYIWYEVREVIPSALRPLDQVRDEAKAAVLAGKMRAFAAERAKAIVAKAQAGATLDALAAEAGAAVETTRGLRRGETVDAFDAAAVSAVFSVPETGFAFTIEPDGKGAKIMQSQAVLLAPFDATSPDARALETEVSKGAAGDILTAYLNALQNDIGITVNETLWRQISGTASP